MSSFPLFGDKLISGHDMSYHMLRIESIKDGILSGQFPVRLSMTPLNGYGYPQSVFYGDILLYIPAFFRIIGFPLSICYKLYVLFINIGTCIFSYICVKEITRKEIIAITGAAIYTLFPYRLINVYMRAAVGEYTAMMFFPVIFLGIYKIYFDNTELLEYKNNYLLPVIGFSGIINSHILSCELVGIITVATACVMYKKTFRKETIIVWLKIIVLSILLNLFFLVPFMDYMIRGGFSITEAGPEYIQEKGFPLLYLFNIFPVLGGVVTNVSSFPLPLLVLSVGLFTYIGLFMREKDYKLIRLGE